MVRSQRPSFHTQGPRIRPASTERGKTIMTTNRVMAAVPPAARFNLLFEVYLSLPMAILFSLILPSLQTAGPPA